MKSLDLAKVIEYVEVHVSKFHEKRLLKIKQLSLKEVLQRKNPYLFKAKNIFTAQVLVENILDAYLSSQEETLFGEFMEGLAIFIGNQVVDTHKSKFEGIDMQFERDEIIYLVQIKSGPNWGNSSQIKKLRENFSDAKQSLAQQIDKQVIAINGCCYGREKISDKGDYQKLCGQEFWHFISGEENLYTQLIEPIGYRAKEKNQAFLEAYGALINQFTAEFYKSFCSTDGYIIWEKLVAYNSAKFKIN